MGSLCVDGVKEIIENDKIIVLRNVFDQLVVFLEKVDEFGRGSIIG